MGQHKCIVFFFLLKIFLLETNKVQGENYGTYVNNGSLVLNEGSFMTIDTDRLSATVETSGTLSQSYSMELTQHNFTDKSGETWNYSVARLWIAGNITLSSIIEIKGPHALSVISVSGSIMLNTTLNVTCGFVFVNTTVCLGGFLPQNSSKIKNVPAFNNAHGPGDIEDFKFGNCFPGAGHGGRGGMNTCTKPPYRGCDYGTNDTTALLGGTAGIFQEEEYGVSGAGGGAIELVAMNGSIVVGKKGKILANAQQGRSEISDPFFAGSSGGIIRLKANEVKLEDNSILEANGSGSGKGTSRGNDHNPQKKATNGGGGIVQILASKGVISKFAQISLGKGTTGTVGCNGNLAQRGYLKISDVYANNTEGLNDFCWNKTTRIQCPSESQETFSATSTTKNLAPSTAVLTTPVHPTSTEALSSLTTIMKLRNVSESVKMLKHEENASALIVNLETLEGILRKESLVKEAIEVLVDFYEELSVVLQQLVKDHDVNITQVLMKLIDIADLALADRNDEGWMEYHNVTRFYEALERVATPFVKWVNLAPDKQGFFQHITNKIALQVITKPTLSGDYVFPSQKFEDASWNDVNDKIVIPHDAFSEEDGNITFLVILNKGYKNWTQIKRGLPEMAIDGYKLNSNVFSFSAFRFGKQVTKLEQPAKLYFQQQNSKEETKLCVFWNDTITRWSTEGVTTDASATKANETICSTTHLTSFAVLMQFKPIELTEDEKISLRMITYIGCGLSIICLIITLVVFIFVDSLSEERHKIHLNLSIAVLLTQATFISSVKASQIKDLCRVVAVFQHYFTSTVFTWMCVEGVHLYMKVVNVFGTEGIKMKKYYIFGWGFPVAWVGIAAAINPQGYGNFNNVCWLSVADDFIWIFLGPVVAIILMNTFVMIMVVRIVVSSSSINIGTNNLTKVKAGIKSVFLLLPILGLSWVFGLLMVGKPAKVFMYLFTIFNSFEGVFIFLLYCVGNSEVRASFRRMREKAILKSGEYNASFSLSNNDSAYSSGKGISSGVGKIKEKVTKPRSKTKVTQVKPATKQSSKEIFIVNNKTFKHSLSPSITPDTGASLNFPEDDVEEIVLPITVRRTKTDHGQKKISMRSRKS